MFNKMYHAHLCEIIFWCINNLSILVDAISPKFFRNKQKFQKSLYFLENFYSNIFLLKMFAIYLYFAMVGLAHICFHATCIHKGEEVESMNR